MIANRSKHYPRMKDSGIPWLGKIPEHWKIIPGRACFKEIHRSNTGLIEKSVLSLSYGRIVNKPEDKLHGLVPASFETYQIVEPGDIICRPTDLQNDKTSLRFGISDHRGIITSAYICLKSLEHLGDRFGYILLHAYDLKKIFYGLGSGLRQNLDWRDFKTLPCLLPSSSEQSAIISYLDYIDRRIRRYIRAKQKLIKLLEEQKQAIIHSAVTRGLDSNARLKPSGVDWLGDVPGHWKVQRLKTVVSSITSGSRGWSNFAADDGPLFIRIGNMTRASIGLDLTDCVKLKLPEDALTEAARTRVLPNDLLLSITAYIGSVAVVPNNIGEAYISQHVSCCRPISGAANVKWLAYVLLSPIGQTHGKLCMYGGTKQGLSLDDVKNYIVVLPPHYEQDLLVAWIENATKHIDETMHSTYREISLLREYRTRLTADVVTGKLDVREAAANLPATIEEPESPDEIDLLSEGEENTADDLEANLQESEA